jgi:hypothetical protein
MKIALALVILIAALTGASAAELYSPRAQYAVPIPPPPPMALRGINKQSAAIRLSDSCWRSCEAHCGAGFQRCIRESPYDFCVFHNNACDLHCQRECRIKGGPIVNWVDY